MYLIDESTGHVVALEEGRYRLVRNASQDVFDAVDGIDYLLTQKSVRKLISHPESTDLGHIEIRSVA